MSDSHTEAPASAEQALPSLERYVPREILSSLTAENQQELDEKGITEVDISREKVPGTEKEVYRPIYHFKINLKGTTTESALAIERTTMEFFAKYPDLGRIFGIRGGVDGFMNGYIRPKIKDTDPANTDRSALKDAISLLATLQDSIITIGQAADTKFRCIFAVAEKQTTKVTISKYGKDKPRYTMDSADSLTVTGIGWAASKKLKEEGDARSHLYLISSPSSPAIDNALQESGYDLQDSIANEFVASKEYIDAPAAKAPGRRVRATEPTVSTTNKEDALTKANDLYTKSHESENKLANAPDDYSIISESMRNELRAHGSVDADTGCIEGKIPGAHLVVKADYSGLTKLVAVATEQGQDPGRFVKEVLVSFLSPLADQLNKAGKSFLISVEGDAVIFFINAPAEEQLALLGEINKYLAEAGDKLYEHVKKLPQEFRDKTGITKMGMKTIAAVSLVGDPPTDIRIYPDGVISYNTQALKLEDRMEQLAKHGGNTASMTMHRKLSNEEANALFPQGWYVSREGDEYIYSTRTARTFIEEQMDRAIVLRTEQQAGTREAELLEDAQAVYKEIDDVIHNTDNKALIKDYENNIIGAAKMLFALNESLQPMNDNSEDAYIQELIAGLADNEADTSHDKQWILMLQAIAQQYFDARELAKKDEESDGDENDEDDEDKNWEEQFLNTIPSETATSQLTADQKDAINCANMLVIIGKQVGISRERLSKQLSPDDETELFRVIKENAGKRPRG